MRLMALVSIQDGAGRHAPRTIFEVADEVEGMALVQRGFAVEVFETAEDAKQVYVDPAPIEPVKGKKAKTTEGLPDGGGNTV